MLWSAFGCGAQVAVLSSARAVPVTQPGVPETGRRTARRRDRRRRRRGAWPRPCQPRRGVWPRRARVPREEHDPEDGVGDGRLAADTVGVETTEDLERRRGLAKCACASRSSTLRSAGPTRAGRQADRAPEVAFILTPPQVRAINRALDEARTLPCEELVTLVAAEREGLPIPKPGPVPDSRHWHEEQEARAHDPPLALSAQPERTRPSAAPGSGV